MPFSLRSLRVVSLFLTALAESALANSPANTPLPPPAPAPATALFTRLTASQTGLTVENNYDDPQMWGSRYREFMGGGMGSGVAAGDYDRDGRVDLYVSTKTKPGRLFRNLGGWRFEDVTEAAGLGEKSGLFGWLRTTVAADAPVIWRQGAVFVDVNNDGHLDLHVSRNAAPNLLYLNQGDGTFAEEAEQRGLAVSDGSVIGAFADYDRDGWLDVLVLTNQMEGTEPTGRADRLFRNTGQGHFIEVTAAAGLNHRSFGHAATWFDFDHDRWPDLYIANDFAGPDFLYRNNGDGTFTNVIDAAAPHTPYSSMGADAADVNNDGQIDLLVADMATTTREKDRRGLAASRDDVLTAGTRSGTAPQYMRNALLLNTGLGVFREAAPWAGVHATDWTWSVRFEDFDQDGWTDLHVTNGMVREANNSDLLAGMMRALSDQERIRVMKNAPPLNESNLAYRNRGGTGFEEVTAAWGLAEVGVSFGAATADFDNDGDLDLVYLNYNGGLSVFRNNSGGHHRVLVRLRGERSNHFGVGAVVRVESASAGLQSQVVTVARGYAAGSELVAHFGLGPDSTIKRLIVEWPSGATQVFTELPADRSYVVHETKTPAGPDAEPMPRWFVDAADQLKLRWPDASPLTIPDREQAFLPFRTDRRGPGVASADVDGDGRHDLYLGSTPASPSRLLLAEGGAYRPVPGNGLPDVAPVEEGPPLFLDLDANGTTDLLVTRASANAAAWPAAYRPQAYVNDGAGRFTARDLLPDLAINVGAVCAADVDGDGDLDLFLGARSIPGQYPVTPKSALLRNDGGRYSDATAALPAGGALGLVKSALFRDVDQDGHPDLLLALEWDHVRYLRNDGPGGFVDRTTETGFDSGGRGWWNSLAAGDFNGDGRLDFAAGNLGFNTTYRASPAGPSVLLYGDFARNGTPLLLEGMHDGGALYPTRARVELGARLPFVLRKYPRNDDYARATLADLVGAPAIAAALRREADQFASGAFLSQPDGTYRFVAFPADAQIGPINGLVVQDVDGDGQLDIAAVQNSDAAIPRFHGGVGLLLRGRGEGNFDVLPPTQSGILVPGSAGALVPLDPYGDGRPGLFYTRHGADSGFLQPAGAEGSRGGLEMRLSGPQPNPHGIGARVQLAFASGTTVIQEMGLGGGWWSQAAPVLWVAPNREHSLVSAEVTWPDGTKTRHDRPPAAGIWELRRAP